MSVSSDEVLKIIKRNNVISLQNIIQSRGFNFKMTIRPKDANKLPNSFQNSLNLLQLSAFYGALECFNLLWNTPIPKEVTNPNLLNCSVAGGNITIMNYCLNMGLDMKEIGFTAIAFQRNDMFMWLFQNKIPEIRATSNDLRKTYLHYAAQFNNPGIIGFLLQYGLQPNEVDSQGNTPMCLACKYKCMEAIMALNSIPLVNINLPGPDGAPLHICIKNDSIDIIKILLSRQDCSLNIPDRNGDTPLNLAIKEGKKTLVSLFVKDRRVSFFPNNSGDTPLHTSIVKGNSEVFETLLNIPRIDVNAQNYNMETPLHQAISRKKEDLAKALLQHQNILLDLQDANGRTPLMVAIEQEMNLMARDLINRGSNTELRNKDSQTPIFMAAARRNQTIVAELLKKGANPNSCNFVGTSPLQAAAAANAGETVDLLLRAGAVSTSRDREGMTALLTAAQKDADEAFRLLTEVGRADLNATDHNWNGVLHFAARSPRILRMLEHLNARLNPRAPNSSRKTPLDLASNDEARGLLGRLTEAYAAAFAPPPQQATIPQPQPIPPQQPPAPGVMPPPPSGPMGSGGYPGQFQPPPHQGSGGFPVPPQGPPPAQYGGYPPQGPPPGAFPYPPGQAPVPQQQPAPGAYPGFTPPPSGGYPPQAPGAYPYPPQQGYPPQPGYPGYPPQGYQQPK